MPTLATIRSLRVQATQTADLAFNMPGIVSAQNFDHASRKGPAFLGQRVAAFDMKAQLYDRLGEVADPRTGRLVYDSRKIRSVLQDAGAAAPFLFSIRNEALASALDQAIARREGAWMSRFRVASDTAKLLAARMPEIVTHLKSLATASGERWKAIKAALADGSTPPELKGVLTQLRSVTEIPKSSSRSTTTSNPVAMVSMPFDADKPVPDDLTTRVFEKDGTSGTAVQTHKAKRSASVPVKYRKEDGNWRIPDEGFETQVVSTVADPASQSTTSTAQALGHPGFDNDIGYHQALVAVLQETLRHETASLTIPDTEAILSRELAAMDADIRNLQLNFAHSFLVPPLAGLVTGVFKDVGESVEPGEPVVRIENDEWLLLLGRVQCRAPLRVGRKVKLTAKSVFEDGTSVALDGTVVAIRGHEADNDEWECVIEVQNPASAGGRLLPIGYHFDPDTDSLEVQ